MSISIIVRIVLVIVIYCGASTAQAQTIYGSNNSGGPGGDFTSNFCGVAAVGSGNGNGSFGQALGPGIGGFFISNGGPGVVGQSTSNVGGEFLSVTAPAGYFYSLYGLAVQINGKAQTSYLQIPTNAGPGKFLISQDANGNAYWAIRFLLSCRSRSFAVR